MSFQESPYMLVPWLLSEALRIVGSQLLGLTTVLKAESWRNFVRNSTEGLQQNTTLVAAGSDLHMHLDVPGIMALVGVLISFYLILVVYSYFEQLKEKAQAVVPIKKKKKKKDDDKSDSD